MLSFIFHPQFEKQAASLKRRFPFFEAGVESFKRICESQFDPINPKQIITPAKLHRIKCFENFTIWKVELSVKNLKSSQSPRVWFAIKGTTVVFLCVATHIDNHDDSKMNREAETFVGSFFN